MPETTPHPSRFADDDPFVARVRGLCERYPEVAEVVAHGRPTWRARTRQFAIAGAAHQPEDAVVLRVDPDERQALLERDDVWVPAYEGASGYLAIGAGPGADWDLIEELIDGAYRLVANQRQLRALDADPVVPLAGDA
ncbi:MAG TPA: MmcQ/YjbR family DNA-binding protein [Microbacterium sp.]|uniref:MmcQ/YjbR family DNA-binding protein n=1 Tax=Microbacterium sp. TaxID=51671 RepID=UPI002B94C66E|nr:MmcQ/YjbR family DNA-binding protein [Microbacterium sp.]HWI30611.1 MmcQ/YjbR family DNA-binding protein [Microbacterium sp.]